MLLDIIDNFIRAYVLIGLLFFSLFISNLYITDREKFREVISNKWYWFILIFAYPGLIYASFLGSDED